MNKIEDAPRDGTAILAYWKGDDCPCVIQYSADLGEFVDSMYREEVYNMAYWKPLPPENVAGAL